MLPVALLSLSLLAPLRPGLTAAPAVATRCFSPACSAAGLNPSPSPGLSPRHPQLGARVARAARLAVPAAAITLGVVAAAPTAAFAASAAAAADEHLHLGQKIALFFQQTGLPNWAVLMLISAVPAVELRGGVPVGNWMGIPPLTTFAICVIGNMVPLVPFFLALRSAFVKKLLKPLLYRAEHKLAGLPKGQSRWLALTLFVGVPAPGTGGWTGVIIAYLLGM